MSQTASNQVLYELWLDGRTQDWDLGLTVPELVEKLSGRNVPVTGPTIKTAIRELTEPLIRIKPAGLRHSEKLRNSGTGGRKAESYIINDILVATSPCTARLIWRVAHLDRAHRMDRNQLITDFLSCKLINPRTVQEYVHADVQKRLELALDRGYLIEEVDVDADDDRAVLRATDRAKKSEPAYLMLVAASIDSSIK